MRTRYNIRRSRSSTNVCKFQILAGESINDSENPIKNVNINASHRFARAIMNDTNKNTL